jgi:hypothetical protein
MWAGQQIRTVAGVGATSSTNTSFANITDMGIDLWTRGGDVRVTFEADLTMNAAGGAFTRISVQQDGGADTFLGTFMPDTAGRDFHFSGSYIFTNLAPGRHLYKIRWQVSSSQVNSPQWRYMTVQEILD